MKVSLLFVVAILCFAVTNSPAQKRNALVPDFSVAQYAGSIGYASIGLGYDLTKKFRGSIHYGYVPESKGGNLNILSSKFVLTPLVLRSSKKIQIQPIDFGLMTTYHFGKYFHNRWPSRYPDHYYWWTSALRFHLIVESSVTYLMSNPKSPFKSVTGYIEFNTNDLYLVSFGQNYKSVSFFDIIKSGVGIRVKF